MRTSKSLVSLTFDDGREEQYTKFYPILDEYDLKATFYVVTQRINWKGVMGWDELKTLYKDGNEIGSHTHTHAHLTTLSKGELDSEFRRSHDILRPFNCSTLAYPYGEYNETIVDHAKKFFIGARGYYNPNTRSRDMALNLDLNQERYTLKVFPTERTLPTKPFEALQSCSLFALPFSKFRQTLKELLEYSVKRNAWIIFAIHGTYHGKNVSWIFKKPKEMAKHFAARLTGPSSITGFVREKAIKKDKIPKFRWMCEYFGQNDKIEVLPVSQIIRRYLPCA